MTDLTHLDAEGTARMVDVGEKEPTARRGVDSLAPTSTMRAVPSSSRWVRSVMPRRCGPTR